MKIFISWSGERSGAVAEHMSDWIKCVIQATKPWISTRDIDRGSVWFSEISTELQASSVGIVCLTKSNKDSPWILFETGALAKGLSTNRVCTFLVDLDPEDIVDPLAQFNHTKPTRESMWGLVRTINASLEDNKLEERILEQAFNTYWPQFEKGIKDILKRTHVEGEATTAERSQEDMLAEILNTTRALNRRVSGLEKSSNSDTAAAEFLARVGLLDNDLKGRERDPIATILNAGSSVSLGDFERNEYKNVLLDIGKKIPLDKND